MEVIIIIILLWMHIESNELNFHFYSSLPCCHKFFLYLISYVDSIGGCHLFVLVLLYCVMCLCCIVLLLTKSGGFIVFASRKSYQLNKIISCISKLLNYFSSFFFLSNSGHLTKHTLHQTHNFILRCRYLLIFYNAYIKFKSSYKDHK